MPGTAVIVIPFFQRRHVILIRQANRLGATQ